MANDIIKFIRQRDLHFKEELGKGACGRTVLLFDDVIDEYFVCKKYSPINENLRKELFANFLREIKILHLVNHPNVVRVYNYYVYPDNLAGYILMEYVEGNDIETYLKSKPEEINEIFLQAIEGFAHLENVDILHRDIRPFNLLVSNSGNLKIIDFGFGKRKLNSADAEKSITLNWWCEPPVEFASQVYDFRTEVYFVGMLFQKVIQDGPIEQFKYGPLLSRMCTKDPTERIDSFQSVLRAIWADKFADIDFENWEKRRYRELADALSSTIIKIEKSTRYHEDPDDIQRRLENCYRSVMLEENVPNNPIVISCFLNGAYTYRKRPRIQVDCFGGFLDLIRGCSREKRNVIIGNLHTRLDSIERYDDEADFDDDIPF